MTNPHPEPSSREATVTQADREAASSAGSLVGRFTSVENAQIRLGQLDDDPLVRAFARHRLAAEQSRASTPAVGREAIAWAIVRAATEENLRQLREYGNAGPIADAILALHPPAMEAENARLREQADAVALWLDAALRCEAFVWDVDQWEAASGCLIDLRATLTTEQVSQPEEAGR